MKKALVTGCSGLIGREICKQLASAGQYHIIGVDNNDKYPEFVPLNCEFIQQDVRKFVDEYENNFDIIFHMAAINGTDRFYKDPNKVLETNISIDHSVFGFAKTNAKTKIVYGSSSEVVSDTDNFPTKEEEDIKIVNIHNPRWSYRIAKIQSENYLANSNLNYLILRFFNVYSENSHNGHFVYDVTKKLRNQNYSLYGANETRSFCYVRDAVKAVLAVSDVDGEIINIGSDEELTVLEAATIIKNSLQLENIDWALEDSLPGSCIRRKPDLQKLRFYYPDYYPEKFKDVMKEIVGKIV